MPPTHTSPPTLLVHANVARCFMRSSVKHINVLTVLGDADISNAAACSLCQGNPTITTWNLFSVNCTKTSLARLVWSGRPDRPYSVPNNSLQFPSGDSTRYFGSSMGLSGYIGMKKRLSEGNTTNAQRIKG